MADFIVANGKFRIMILLILLSLLALTAFTFLVSFWPVALMDSASATAYPLEGEEFKPGCPVQWEVIINNPVHYPLRHNVQLIVFYEGSNWVLTYDPHEGRLRRRTEKKGSKTEIKELYNGSVVETGEITLPRGKILENRRFKIRHTYILDFYWRDVFVTIESPWYKTGAFPITPWSQGESHSCD